MLSFSASLLFRFLTYLTSIINLIVALNLIGRTLQLIEWMKELSVLCTVAVNWVTPPGTKCGDNLVPGRKEKSFLISLPSSCKRGNMMMQHIPGTANNLILQIESLISQTQ